MSIKTKKPHHLPLFEDHKYNPLDKVRKESLMEGVVVVGSEEEDNTSQATKDYAKEMMTFLHNNDVSVYSNRMYSEKDGSAHIPIKHADAYDQGIVDEFNKKGQKIRKLLSKGGFSDFDTKFETDKIMNGSTLFLTISPK